MILKLLLAVKIFPTFPVQNRKEIKKVLEITKTQKRQPKIEISSMQIQIISKE